jgi:hypothetical protein
MPVLELTEEQIVALLRQMPENQRKRVIELAQEQPVLPLIPQFGVAKGAMHYMAPDFDVPLDDFKEYM